MTCGSMVDILSNIEQFSAYMIISVM